MIDNHIGKRKDLQRRLDARQTAEDLKSILHSKLNSIGPLNDNNEGKSRCFETVTSSVKEKPSERRSLLANEMPVIDKPPLNNDFSK